ncbi:MAG: 50S ribosomal protein L32 [Planctomycetes bacterium]|nr:50S ribosomal protein L32 [Planctomycetota bacterium]
MAVPQRKTNQARKLKRRAHDAIRPVSHTHCSRCNSLTLPHSICDNCGTYRGRTLLAVEDF